MHPPINNFNFRDLNFFELNTTKNKWKHAHFLFNLLLFITLENIYAWNATDYRWVFVYLIHNGTVWSIDKHWCIVIQIHNLKLQQGIKLLQKDK